MANLSGDRSNFRILNFGDMMMSTFLEYLLVFIIVILSFYYVWTKVIFKKSKDCNGCGKCSK